RDIGVTAIYVTHDQAEAMSLSHRIAVMWSGRILQSGSPRELYGEAPGGRVGGFLGRPKGFEGRLVGRRGPRARVLIDGAGQPLECRTTPDARLNAAGVLSVRPEAVTVKPAGPTLAGDALGRISSAMYLGKLSQLQIRLESGKTIEALELTRRTWNVGDPVAVTFDPEQCFFIAQSAEIRQAS